MQRKTNLFYTKSNDSNFLTFSNFTEALTGNFLSTDWKVYPSRFLCLYIPGLMDENNNLIEEEKERFIKDFLVSYYENKLAFLRDYYTNEYNQNNISGYDIEGDVNALAWLFKTIEKFDNTYEINFIGEVTEFDYKGTYTDAICIIDASEGYYKEGDRLVKYTVNVDSQREILYNENINTLYNWTDEELNGTPYEGVGAALDNNNSYDIYSEVELTEEANDASVKTLKFNVIIPLFDIINIYADTNFDTIMETFSKAENLTYKHTYFDEEENEWKTITNDYTTKALRSINNPMGIWFADELIELKRDADSKYAPSWSITISSQFKPFPYSVQYNNNDITPEDNQQAFQTYAQILSKHMSLNNEITNLSTRILKLEQKIDKLNNLQNNEIIEELHNFNLLKSDVEKALGSLDAIIDEKVNEAIKNKEYIWK